MSLQVLLSLLPGPDERADLLGVLLPVLVSHLLVERGDLKDAGVFRLKLHESALVRLTQLGRGHPQEVCRTNRRCLAHFASVRPYY
jgi:hypothetical protein